jgi:hypothetical protein
MLSKKKLALIRPPVLLVSRRLSIELDATARNPNARRSTASALKEVFLAMKNANAKTVKTWVLNVKIIKT